LAKDGLDEVIVVWDSDVGAVGDCEGYEGVEDEGDSELLESQLMRWILDMEFGRTICFLWSGLRRSMCTRWTRAGSSCGRSGCRAAGDVVKGAGMALVLLFTAAADLAKDLADRLVGLGAILNRVPGLDLWCRRRVRA
jgi:hypothetical protein